MNKKILKQVHGIKAMKHLEIDRKDLLGSEIWVHKYGCTNHTEFDINLNKNQEFIGISLWKTVDGKKRITIDIKELD